MIYLNYDKSIADSIRVWQLYLESNYNAKFLNPHFNGGNVVRLESVTDVPLSLKKDIAFCSVEKELADLRRCKSSLTIITGFDEYGIVMKMAYARQYNIPNDSIILNKRENDVWLFLHSRNIFTSYEDYEHFLKINNGNLS